MQVDMKKIYVDNSSTTFPKAVGVSDVIKNFLDNGAYNAGRGSYGGAYDISMEILEARQLLADMLKAKSPQEIIFTPGATYSINMILQGLLKSGDHVITTSMEHNAVMRPLHALLKKGVSHTIVNACEEGFVKADDFVPLIKEETKAIVMLHASNVCGTIMPIDEVSKICQKHNIRLIVDAAQTAGILDIDVGLIDALVFAGHKGLLAPAGIGGFVIKRDFAKEIAPVILGGTGSFSHELEHPSTLPDKFEAGTINIPAILGLKKAIEYINMVGMEAIHEKEMALTSMFLSGLEGINDIRVIGKKGISDRVAVVSLDFLGRDNAAVAALLDERYGIMARCGLHCAPNAHKSLKTYPHGTIRFSFGHFNTVDEVKYILQAIKDIMIRGGNCGL